MDRSLDPNAPVLVTGATGYVAGWVVKELLDRGHTVHAAVRDPASPGKVRHLDELAAAAPGEIRYFAADLLEEGSYDEAMAGCELVFHTASPFTAAVDDPQKELVEPALHGTRNVLGSAGRTPSVKRIVLTSSTAAIQADNADLRSTPDGVFTEEVWNTTASLEHQPYSYSKTVAEREAWAIAGRQEGWDLVVVNPCLVMGPGVRPEATSESFALIRQLGDGSFRTGVPPMGTGLVDVRDVAVAHLRAGFTPEASGRYIVKGHDSDFAEFVEIVRERYGDRYPIPKRVLPVWLIWLVGPMIDRRMTRRMVRRNMGLPWKADASKGVRELGLTYRPLETTLVEMFEQVAATGALDRARRR